VLVFREDADGVLGQTFLGDRSAFAMAGPFHDGAILAKLREAALSSRAPLITGPSGSGKELAAAALARFWGLSPPRRYNASAAATPEEMSRALFGVARGAYTGVEAQDGLIVTADKAGQPLFLDEVHNLPAEAQATLLTVIEDNRFTRKGAESKELEVSVRFVFASNEPDRLKPDLRARLWQVKLPPLSGRVADVPALFDSVLDRALARQGIPDEPIRDALDADLYCDLCLEALRGEAFAKTNVRGLLDLADRIAARVSTGVDPIAAIDSVLEELGLCGAGVSGDGEAGGGGQYERYRELIALRTVELLKASGVPWTVSRRHLNTYIKRWGLKEG
jgi:transcriptional regulator with AAA-type ATPase domain